MRCLEECREQLTAAADLSAILDAAYACLTVMLRVIESQQDPNNPLFVPFVLAGASAASGRFALAAAPSLTTPAPIPHRAPGSTTATPAATAVLALGQLSELLDRRLRDAARVAVDADDRQACATAARHAAELSARFGRTPQS